MYTGALLDFLPIRSPLSSEQSSLSHPVDSHSLSISYVVSLVYICQSESPDSPFPYSFPTPALEVQTFVLYVCLSLSTLQIRSSMPFF